MVAGVQGNARGISLGLLITMTLNLKWGPSTFKSLLQVGCGNAPS